MCTVHMYTNVFASVGKMFSILKRQQIMQYVYTHMGNIMPSTGSHTQCVHVLVRDRQCFPSAELADPMISS